MRAGSADCCLGGEPRDPIARSTSLHWLPPGRAGAAGRYRWQASGWSVAPHRRGLPTRTGRAVDTGPMARGRRLGRERWPGWGLAAGTGETELRAGSANFRRLLPGWGAARPDRQEHVITLASAGPGRCRGTISLEGLGREHCS